MAATEQLTILASMALGYCEAVLQDGKEIVPQITYENGEGLGVISLPDYGDWRQKRKLQAISRLAMKEGGATAYVFHMEAWVSDGNGPGGLPSKDPNRTEAVIIIGNDINGNGLCWHYPIKRDMGFVWLAERIVMTKFVAMSGPIGELLAKNKMLNDDFDVPG